MNWTTVYKTKDIFEANLIKQAIENQGIDTVLLDKTDSSYAQLFTINEIKVNSIFKEKALGIILETKQA